MRCLVCDGHLCVNKSGWGVLEKGLALDGVPPTAIEGALARVLALGDLPGAPAGRSSAREELRFTCRAVRQAGPPTALRTALPSCRAGTELLGKERLAELKLVAP